jgi:hypothetical protein
MASGLRSGLQRHPDQGQPADDDDSPQRGRGELRVPVLAAQLLEDLGEFTHDRPEDNNANNKLRTSPRSV